MKNFLSVLSSTLQGGLRGGLLFLALLTTSSLWAYDFQSGDLYYYITSDTIPYTAEVTYQYRSNINYSGLTEITIPSSVTYNNITYTVTSIGENAFENCSNLTSITIPNSVTNIGYCAFYGCSSLTSITIPNSVTSIGWSALYGCSSITSITIPESVTGIGSGAFKNTGFYNDKSNWDDGTLYIDNCLIEVNQSLSGAYTIKDSTRVIADDAFDQCYKLTSITIPESVVSIGKQAFYGCSSLASIIIPNSVTVIGEEAFRDCSVLTSITIPKGVTSIGDDAFYRCLSLTSVVWNAINCKDFDSSNPPFYHYGDISYQIISFTFGDCVEHIPANLCYQMVKLQSIDIPESVTSIGAGAFSGSSSLTSATIGNSVTNIGEDAFRGCSSLISITIPNSVTSIGEYAFADCFSLSNMTIGNSVTSIGYAAFRNCSALASITIPNSVTSIGDPDAGSTTKVGAFYGCSSLTSVVWNATNYENITESGNAPFHRIQSQITSFTFGEDVRKIPAYLCSGMTNLQSIVIPNSVDSVKYYAFNGCSSLKSVRIGEGLKYIDRRAFYECTAIESVEWNAINCNVKFYENDVNPMLFYYSREQISSFAFGDNVEFIPQHLCYGMDKLKSIVIPNSVTNIGNSAFSGCSSLTSITIPNSVTNIGNSAFRGCSSLTSITIPNSVTRIGEYAFGGSTDSLLVTLKIKSIEDYMQRKVNDQLYEASLKLPKRILSINDEEITDIIVPENIDSISDYAFYNCYHIRSISLHDNNKYLGEYALSGCTSLTSIQLPYNIEGLTKTSLSNCYSIQSITITAPSIEEYCQSYINSNLYDYGFAESAKRNIVINGQAVTDLVIPEPVTTIGELVFYNCTTLTSLTLPKHVASIEWGAFYGCEALESIYQKSMTPPAVQSYALSSYPVCYVPYGSLSAYENSAWAEQVSHFVEEPLRGYKIYYTTSNGQIINPSISDPFDATIMSNVYENGQGVIAFEGPVSTIKAGAFSNCSNLTSITIPVSIKQIENQAFANCSALGVVDVKCITPPVLGNEVFTSAPTCYIPCGTKHLFENSAWSEQVGEFIAEECGGNKIFYTTIDGDIITPSETVDFGAKMISNVYEFGQGVITFDAPVTHMAGFSNCNTLTSITIPESVTTVGGSCFGNCSLLTSIVWNAKHVEQVKWGGGSWLGAPLPAYDMFEGVRSQITSFVFGESVEYIPDYLCYYMENLREIIIPESVQGIGTYAFSRCSALTSAVIGNNVKTIGEHAFSYCSSLTSTTIGKSVITIGEEAFRDCSALTSIVIPDSVLAIENSTFFNCSALTSVTLNNSLISIYDYAFMDCSSLTSITIPENVTYIGGRVFYDCSALTSVTWNAMDCGDFVDYYSDGRKVPSSRFEGCPITSFTFGDNVEYIPGGLCYQMTGLQSIVLPENVYSIGDYAFYGCSSLTSITIPEHVYSMGERAFYGCSSLASITIPENVSSIGGYAFSYCSSLKTVAWNAINPEEIIIEYGSSIVSPFSNSPIESLIIGDRVTYIPKKLCDNCSTLTSVTIGKKVKEIGADAFYGCSALAQTNYTGDIAGWCQIALGSFSSNPTYNSKNLFINGEEVKDVVIPNTVTSISSCAFYNCEKISSLTISESVKSIGYNAFGGCKKLFDIYCYPTTPPEAQENSFTNYNVNLYVPCESLKDYQMDMVFGSFKYIQCLEDTPPSEPQDTIIYHPTVYDVICEGETYIWMGIPYTEAGTYTYEEIVEDENYIYHNIYTLELTVIPPEIVVLPEEAYGSYEWHGEVYTESGVYFYEEWCYQEILELTIIPSQDNQGEVIVEPSTNSVTITWQKEDDADTYIIVIKQGDKVVCTLIFDAEGNLVSVNYLPGRESNKHGIQHAGLTSDSFQYTITGLTPSTDYTYTVTATDDSDNTISSYSGEFTTHHATSVENTNSQSPTIDCQKIIRDGQLYIYHNGSTYNVMGVIVE